MAQQRSRWVAGCALVALLAALGLGAAAILAGMLGHWGVAGLAGGPAVGVVEVFGVIGTEDRVIEQLDHLEGDRSVRALVLHIDSPGGGVAATQRIVERLDAFRQERDLPVVAALETVAASGGYYVACAADSILTLAGTLTGSIGVIMSFPQASELMAKLGVDLEVVKTGAMKDAGSPHRPLTDTERRWFGAVLDDVLAQFVDAILAGRPALDAATLERLADGRIFSGRQAVTLGLADRLGTFEDAVKMAGQLAGIGDARVVRQPRRQSLYERLVEGRLPKLQLLAPVSRTPALEYRWR